MNMVIQWIRRDLHNVRHLFQISAMSGHRPHSVVAPLKKPSPVPGPFYHTYIILLEIQAKLEFILPSKLNV